jgi:hypothetical protein
MKFASQFFLLEILKEETLFILEEFALNKFLIISKDHET